MQIFGKDCELHLHSTSCHIEHCFSVGAVYLADKLDSLLVKILHLKAAGLRRGGRIVCCRVASLLSRSKIM